MNKTARILAVVLAGGSFAASRLLPFRVRKPSQSGLMMPKVTVEAVAPYVGAIGLAGSVLGLLSGVPLARRLGFAAAASATRYTLRVLRPHGDFKRAFGPGWETRIPAEVKGHMLRWRWTWRMRPVPEPRWQRDVPFWSIPGREEALLCDIWQPPAGTPPWARLPLLPRQRVALPG